MGDVVNLRRARKSKARADKEKSAAANRAQFGRGKSEKASTRAESERAARALDAKRRERDPD